MARDDELPAASESVLHTPSLTVAALIVAAGFLGSRVLGLLRSVIIAHSFGTSPELDAYWVAFRLPDLVFQLLAGATLASAFIPTFTGIRTRDGEEAAWRLASSVLNLVLIATVAFAAIAFVLAPLLVPLMAPGLGEGTGREQELRSLAVDLTRIMLISPVFFAVSGMFMGILNARRHFLMPALAPMFYNLAIIAGALIAKDVQGLAVAVVVGALLHLAVQLPDLRAAGMAYRMIADWRDTAVREVASLMAPRILGLAASQLNFYFIAIFFASTLGSGAISAMTFASLIVMTPLGVIGMSISTAAFPTLAEQAADDEKSFAPTLVRALRMILYLSLPAAVALMLLAKPLVVVLLQRGAFDAISTQLTAQALIFYALGLVAFGGIEILSRGFYALSDTRTPVKVAIGTMALNLLLSALLVGPMGVRGLALALSISATFEFLALFALLRRRVPQVGSESLADGLMRMVIAALVMAATVAGFMALLVSGFGFNLDDSIDSLIVLCGGALIGVSVYVVATIALGCEEPRRLLARVPHLPAALAAWAK